MDSQDNAFPPKKYYFARLPIELQTQIFTECISQPFGQLMDEHQAPQVLVSVCKDWRDLAYSTSSLWSSFQVHFGTWTLNFKDPEGDAVLLSRMKLWLRRSGNHFLSVKLLYEPPMPFPRDRKLSRFPEEALALLVQHSSRWRDIELAIPSACFTPLLQSTSELHFPLLNTLILDPTHLPPPYRSEPLDACTLASNCGQLTKLHINLEAGRSLTLDDCRSILSQNPNITSCTLYVQCEGSPTPTAEKLSLPVLSELHLMVYSNRVMVESYPERALTAFLGGLDLYMLKYLHIDWLLNTNRQAWSSSHPAFISFLEPLKPTLESLRLGYVPMSEAQVMECLRAVPFLTFVELLFTFGEEPDGPAITDRLWRGLTFVGGDEVNGGYTPGTLLPLLQSMKLQCHGSGCSEKELVRFVNSRADMESLEFRSLVLRTAMPVLRMEKFEQEVSRWRSRGIEVRT